jgi:hypothetical protein
MDQVLDFKNPVKYSTLREDLKLILWAGDGEHKGVTDIERLADYDVYVCLGLGNGVDKNAPHLRKGQVLCLINMTDENQTAEFYRIFEGRFAHVYADYFGNTPTLPADDYRRLLAPGGIAHNIDGINGIIMPLEDILDRLELLAPVLSPDMHEMRMWSKSILDLAKRDDLSPGAVWSSPDLKHPYYELVRLQQNQFVKWQKRRNPQWPLRKATLEEHWSELPISTLTVSLHRKSMEGDTSVELLEPHLPAFERFLMERIAAAPPNIEIMDGEYSLQEKQTIARYIQYQIPDGLTGRIGHYRDDRRGTTIFGMQLVH